MRSAGLAVSGEKVAEKSGFATDLPQSAYLAHTIRRAISAAEQRSHRYVTLEHLLLALLDDPDAMALMEVARTDVPALRSATTETVNHSLATLYTPGTFDLHASYKVERVLQSASDDARRMGCAEVDGAFVAVALFHETDSAAYDLLKRHNFVFHAANGWLDRNRGARPARHMPTPAPQPALPAAPETQTRPAFPAAASEEALDDLDEEILLEEVSDDEEDLAGGLRSGSAAEGVRLPPYFEQRRHGAETEDSRHRIGPAARGEETRRPGGDVSPELVSSMRPGTEHRPEFERERPPRRGATDPRDLRTDPILPPSPSSPGDPSPSAEGMFSPGLGGAIPRRSSDASASPTGPDFARSLPEAGGGRRGGGLAGSTIPARSTGPSARANPRGETVPVRPGEGAARGSEADPALSERADGNQQQRPGLGAAIPARELAAPDDWRAGHAPRRAEPAPVLPERPASPTFPGAGRTEPRLPVNAERGPGLGAAIPAREQGVAHGRDQSPDFEASPGIPLDGDLGLAAPARDVTGPAWEDEAMEGRPARTHATARERSNSAIQPPSPASAAPGAGAPSPNGASRGAALGERRAGPPAPSAHAPSAPAPRGEPSLPPAARLDDMRVRPAGPPSAPPPPPAPVAAKAGKKSAAREKDGDKARARRRPSASAVYTGKLAENIPRKMKAFKPERIEVRVTREETETFLAGMEGSMEAFRHDLLVTQAMSVLLRAPDGGFTIETIAPETQWIFNRPGGSEKEPFGRWRWSVTPTETGPHRLQLVVAARSVDQHGLAGDTALPDQVINVTVRANYGRGILKALRWVVLMALGGAITEGALQVIRLLGKG
jgi:hypothetical protein